MPFLPPVTQNGTQILSRVERDALKQDPKQFGRFNKKWNDQKFASVENAGSLMDLIRRSQSANEDEWHHYYINHRDGQTLYELERVAAKWAFMAGIKHSEIALAHVIIHILDETWDGFKREQDLIAFLNSNWLFNGRVFRPEKKWDEEYAIDIAVRTSFVSDEFIECFQVKPHSFFVSKNIDWHKEKIQAQHRRAEKEGLKPMFLDADVILATKEFKPIHWSEIIQKD